MARTNVQQWQRDRNRTLDLVYLESLGPGAWPALCELAALPMDEARGAQFIGGARETVRHLRLTLGGELVVKETVATEGEGVDDLREELDRRWAAMRSDGALDAARERKRIAEATLVAEEWIRRTGGNGATARPDDLKQAVKQILEEASSKWEV